MSCVVGFITLWSWERVTGKQSFPGPRRLAEVCYSCQSCQQGTGSVPFLTVLATLHSFYLFRLLQSACSVAPVRPSSPSWTTWIPPPASTDPPALPHAGCQPSQARILTHFGLLNWKQQCEPDQKESGDCLTTRQAFNNWWVLAAMDSISEVLEFPSLTTDFLADILFMVIAVVSFGISSVLQNRKSLLKELFLYFCWWWALLCYTLAGETFTTSMLA